MPWENVIATRFALAGRAMSSSIAIDGISIDRWTWTPCDRQRRSFVGRHDFASFQASGADPKKTTTRHIRACELIEQETTPEDVQHWAIEVEADGFLYNMVRNIVGTLVEVGRGKQSPDWIAEVIEARNRCAAGPTAPAHALFLVRVDYPEIASGPLNSHDR